MPALTPPGDPNVHDWVALTAAEVPGAEMTAWATTPACGAVVTFLGVVRDHAEGRDGVERITYEAYEEAAADAIGAVVREVRRRYPALGRVAVVHRVGDVALSEASVAVVVSAAHRAEAFDGARCCIDLVKEAVPIWKREHHAGGSGWGTDARPIRVPGGDRAGN